MKKQSNPNQSFSVAARLNSFRHAFSGLAILWREQHNLRLHALATGLVLMAGLYFSLTRMEWLAVVLAVGLVWALEAANSALEYLCDVVSPDYDPLIGKAKDTAAAAVLLGALTAAAIGFIVFVPYLRTW